MNPIIVILVLYGLISAVSKAGKKKNQAAGAGKKATPVPPHTARKVMKQIDPSVWDKIDKAAAQKAEKPADKAVPAWKSGEGYDPCHEEMLSGIKPRGHEEGADPCHEYMLNDLQPEGESTLSVQEELQARELLRGVILSEILQKPKSAWSRR